MVPVEAHMGFCCATFASHVDEAGKNAFAVVARTEADCRFFCLQFRVCQEGETIGLLEWLKTHRAPVRNLKLVGQVGLPYCPYCGTDLSEWIHRNLDEFDRLTEKHRSLVLGW